jgi:Ca2+-binding EF-hand superfamily protein
MQERRREMTERATARFQEMDTNGDDAVSLTEFQEANFLSLDSDNNGLLSAEELRPKRPERRRPGGERNGKRGGRPRGV